MTPKTIVTHMSPDPDALTSSWLVKRFLPDWEDAEMVFVAAGATLNDAPPDEDKNIIHVDTGLGKFDHHQDQGKLSATKKVFEYLKANDCLRQKHIPAFEKLVDYITTIDNFGEVFFPDPTADIYDVSFHQIVVGLKPQLQDDIKVVEFAHTMLDSILMVLKNKVNAEKEIEKGLILQISWGKALIMETKNEETMKVAQKMGYVLVARKDPDSGNIRIKTRPEDEYDLTPVYKKIKRKDKKGTWYMHISNHMLLNGSSKNPNFIPSPLTLADLVEIIKAI
jgi:hypothetical protein